MIYISLYGWMVVVVAVCTHSEMPPDPNQKKVRPIAGGKTSRPVHTDHGPPTAAGFVDL